MLHHKIINSHIKQRTVVFLHGFLESSTMWEILDLSQFNFCSILIDLPGHGKSNLEIEIPSIIEIAKSVKSTLVKLGIIEYDIIGHSLGGYVAIELHKLNNSKGKICLMHSNFWEDDENKKQDRNRVIEIVKTQKDFFIKEAIPNLFLEKFRRTPFIENLIQEALRINQEAIIFHTIAMRDRESNCDYIIQNSAKVFIIQGREDKIVLAGKMAKYNKSLKIQLIESAGHMGHFEQTHKIQKTLKIF
jgi:pimeloyl-ACP methyl ester carboxylesterase